MIPQPPGTVRCLQFPELSYSLYQGLSKLQWAIGAGFTDPGAHSSLFQTQAYSDHSSFATKSHALFCRPYTKGRDWYDFVWYINRSVLPELELLARALEQQGPWAGQNVQVSPEWYVEQMEVRIAEIDWGEARSDVERFVPAREQEGLSLWSADFFLYQLRRLAELIKK